MVRRVLYNALGKREINIWDHIQPELSIVFGVVANDTVPAINALYTTAFGRNGINERYERKNPATH